MGECTIRLLDEEKFERDVIGGKREGIDWTGFLKTSWIDSVRRRRRAISKRCDSFLATLRDVTLLTLS